MKAEDIQGGHKVYFWVVLGIGFLLYIAGVFNNLNALRVIHAAYIRGFYFQKECQDEYTEYESLRRHAYEALKTEKTGLDAGGYIFLLLFFWLLVATVLLLVGHMVGISTVWLGVFALLLAYIMYILTRISFDPDAYARFYTFFEGSYCDQIPVITQTAILRLQLFFALATAVAIYGYASLQGTYDNGNRTVFLGKFPNFINESARTYLQNAGGSVGVAPFGLQLYEYAKKFRYVYFALVMIWVFAYLWLSLSLKRHTALREQALCHYEVLMNEYKELLLDYIYPEANRDQFPTAEAYEKETEVRMAYMKDHIERNYLRIHETMPIQGINEDTIGDYVIYLRNWRGREFEDLPESPELNRLREFMYRLRNDRVYEGSFKDYFRFGKWYYWIQMILVVYVAFHVLYQNVAVQKILVAIVGAGILVGLFVLSWYAWFDVALKV